MQAATRTIPGPAGGAVGFRSLHPPSATQASPSQDPDFRSSPWLAALQILDLEAFDATHPLLHDNAARANSVSGSSVLNNFLALVVSVQKTPLGEALIRLKDPSGHISGTLTAGVLELEPDLAKGSVLMLRKVVVLKTPPPSSVSHLCIRADNIAQIIPAGIAGGGLRERDGGLPLLLDAASGRAAEPLPPLRQHLEAARPAWGQQGAQPRPESAGSQPRAARPLWSQGALSLSEPAGSQPLGAMETVGRLAPLPAASQLHAAGLRRVEPLYVAGPSSGADDGLEDLLAGLDDDE